MDSERNISANEALFRADVLEKINSNNKEVIEKLHDFEKLLIKQPNEERIKEFILTSKEKHERDFHLKVKDTPLPYKSDVKRQSFSFINKMPFVQIAKIATFVGFLLASAFLGMTIGG